MAETARKRFDINEKSSTKCRVGKTDFRTDCAKRALTVGKIDKQNTGLIHVTNLFPYFLNPLFPLPKWQYVQNPCPIRLSAGGGGLNPLHSTLSASCGRSPLLHSGQTLKNKGSYSVIPQRISLQIAKIDTLRYLKSNSTQAKNLCNIV